MLNVVVSHHAAENCSEEGVVVMILHSDIVLDNYGVGDLFIMSLGCDDKVWKRAVENYLEVHVEFYGKLWINSSIVGAVKSQENLQITLFGITNNNALNFV